MIDGTKPEIEGVNHTVPATEDVAVKVRTPFKKKYFISGLTSKLNISNYSSLKNNEFQ